MSLLRVEALAKAFGGVTAVHDLSFELDAGAIQSIIGPNGAGKTTLFNLITGVLAPSSGRIFLEAEEVTGQAPHRLARRGLARTFQNLQIFFDMTVRENVMVGRHRHLAGGLWPALLGLPRVRRADAEAGERAAEILSFVGLDDRLDAPADSLAYGALKRLEIARALATEPRLLLLDEPAAGCNARETRDIAALIRQIAARGVTVALVEHDMKLVMDISDGVLVLDHGERLAEGTPEEVRRDPAVIAAYLGQATAEGP